ncbi:MAG: acyl-CoA dehydrogenase family protein, partial [Ferrovibrio sp.]
MDKDTLEQTRRELRRFVREKLVPLEKQVADEDRIPDEIRRSFAEMGLYGISIPEEYGGLGLAMDEEVELVFELGWTSPAFRSLFGTNVGIGSQGILIDGTTEQKQTWLPRLASGEVTASFALTEPEAGSDAASVKTRAERQGDHYIVNGTKRFITNAPHAGIFTLMARTDPNNKGAGGVTAFIVEAKTPGITIGKPDKKMGQRGSHTADVIFDNVKVPAANIIGGKEGQGFKTAMKVLDRGRLHISAMCVGAAERLI